METPEPVLLQAIYVPAGIKIALNLIAQSKGTSMRALAAKVIEEFVRSETRAMGGAIKIELPAEIPA